MLWVIGGRTRTAQGTGVLTTTEAARATGPVPFCSLVTAR
jgi:hypothetical protein